MFVLADWFSITLRLPLRTFLAQNMKHSNHPAIRDEDDMRTLSFEAIRSTVKRGFGGNFRMIDQ